MFIISQYFLSKSSVCYPSSVQIYSIALGIILYAAFYMYIMFYNNQYLGIFNKYIIYIVGADLLLSSVYFKAEDQSVNEYNGLHQDQSDEFADDTDDSSLSSSSDEIGLDIEEVGEANSNDGDDEHDQDGKEEEEEAHDFESFSQELAPPAVDEAPLNVPLDVDQELAEAPPQPPAPKKRGRKPKNA